MTLKYKFNLKDINLEDFKVYLFSLFKAFLPKKKIKNINDLESFIQKDWVFMIKTFKFYFDCPGLYTFITRKKIFFQNHHLLSTIKLEE